MIISARSIIGGAWTRQEDRVISLACAQGTKVEKNAVALMFVFVS